MLALSFTCSRCGEPHDGDELEIGADGEQLCARCAEATGQAGAFERSVADASRERAAKHVEALRARGESVGSWCSPRRLREEGCALCEREAADSDGVDMAAESMLPTTGDVDAGEWP